MKASEKQELINALTEERNLTVGDKVAIMWPGRCVHAWPDPPTKEIVTILRFGWSKRRAKPGFAFETANGVRASTTIDQILI